MSVQNNNNFEILYMGINKKIPLYLYMQKKYNKEIIYSTKSELRRAVIVLIPWKLFPLVAIFVKDVNVSLWQPILGMLKMYSEKKIQTALQIHSKESSNKRKYMI